MNKHTHRAELYYSKYLDPDTIFYEAECESFEDLTAGNMLPRAIITKSTRREYEAKYPSHFTERAKINA